MKFTREGEIFDRIGIGRSQNPIEISGVYHFIPRADLDSEGEGYFGKTVFDKKSAKRILEFINSKGLTPFLKEYYGVGKIIKETDKGKCIIKDGILNGVESIRFSEIFGSYVLYEGKKYFIR
jgi:hypothetical protein